MGYRVLNERDAKWQPRKGLDLCKGLEGPFFYPSGAVAYYDPREGKYWDPQTDFYLSNEEAQALQNQVFDKLRG